MSVGAVDTLQRGEVFNQHLVRETGGVNEQVGVDAVVALIYVVGRNPCAEGNFTLGKVLGGHLKAVRLCVVGLDAAAYRHLDGLSAAHAVIEFGRCHGVDTVVAHADGTLCGIAHLGVGIVKGHLFGGQVNEWCIVVGLCKGLYAEGRILLGAQVAPLVAVVKECAVGIHCAVAHHAGSWLGSAVIAYIKVVAGNVDRRVECNIVPASHRFVQTGGGAYHVVLEAIACPHRDARNA